MFAVVRTGGAQHRVSPGDVMIVNRLEGKSGDRIDLSEVLMLDDGKKLQVGAPFLDKTTIPAEILEHKRDKKIIVFKKKRRQGYRRKHGHRQHLTVLRVLDFAGSDIVAKMGKPEVAKTSKIETKSEEIPEKAAAMKPAKPATKASSASEKTEAKKAAPKKAAAAKKTAEKPKAAPKAKKAKEE